MKIILPPPLVFLACAGGMYLSLWLILLSWFLWLGNGLAILGLIFFVPIMNQFQIKQEEQVLLRLFGKAYQQYCQQVRRWI
ncbi:methyltransferase family protein [Avibacterium avium]|uniref:methyltransferase family protein n=1 Tax=Avibacterium avium TaxID=751 RepID=UPI003BF89DBD